MQQILSDDNCGCLRLMACCDEPYNKQMYDCLKHDLQAASAEVEQDLYRKMRAGWRFGGRSEDAEMRLQELHLATETVLQAFAHWTRDNERTRVQQPSGFYYDLYRLDCVSDYLHRVFGLNGEGMLALAGFMPKEGCRWPVKYRPWDLTCAGLPDPPPVIPPDPGPQPEPCGEIDFTVESVRVEPQWYFTLTLTSADDIEALSLSTLIQTLDGSQTISEPAQIGTFTFGPFSNLTNVTVRYVNSSRPECGRIVAVFNEYQVDDATAHDTGISHDLSHG